MMDAATLQVVELDNKGQYIKVVKTGKTPW